ncbi:MAG: iron-containing alcohol dehydrogenase [Halioglobus sp.]
MPAFYKEFFYKARLSLMGKMITKPQPKPLLYLGADSNKQLCKTISQFGVKNILIVTDKPLVELGVVASTLDALSEYGVQTQVYDGVLPDPTRKVVNEGIAMLRANSCDSVLAFGGGSSIDAAKVIALAGANNYEAKDCEGVGKAKLPALPFFAIPTTAGTGSEATFIAVISDDETHQKGAVIDPSIIPKAAALDPIIMQGLPPHITAATGMDALTHAIESYIGIWETDETNYYGLASSKLVFDNLAKACSNGEDLAAREAMALASFYGGMAITNALVGYVHAISHNLGARYSIPHGLGNAMVLPHVLEKLKAVSAKKMAEIAVNAQLGEKGESDSALAQKLIDKVWALNAEIGIPKTTDVIKEEDIESLVDAALKEGSTYPTPRFFEREECREILQSLRASQ